MQLQLRVQETVTLEVRCNSVPVPKAAPKAKPKANPKKSPKAKAKPEEPAQEPPSRKRK